MAAMTGLLAKILGSKRQETPDIRFGKGLWRQHRDRFARAVDRFYTSVSALHTAVDAGRLPDVDAVRGDLEALAQLTVDLNALDERVAEAAAACQRLVPLETLVFPAAGRELLGDVPESLSRASSLVAQSAQDAAMVRAAAVMGTPAGRAAASARRYADDAAAAIAAAEERIARVS